LCWCETWVSPRKGRTWAEKFENWVQRKIFGSEREEVIGCLKLHNEELHDLKSQGVIRIKQRGGCVCGLLHIQGRREMLAGSWWGKCEGKTPLGRPRRKWEAGFKMDLK
jgi:hypothetical protein